MFLTHDDQSSFIDDATHKYNKRFECDNSRIKFYYHSVLLIKFQYEMLKIDDYTRKLLYSYIVDTKRNYYYMEVFPI